MRGDETSSSSNASAPPSPTVLRSSRITTYVRRPFLLSSCSSSVQLRIRARLERDLRRIEAEAEELQMHYRRSRRDVVNALAKKRLWRVSYTEAVAMVQYLAAVH